MGNIIILKKRGTAPEKKNHGIHVLLILEQTKQIDLQHVIVNAWWVPAGCCPHGRQVLHRGRSDQ